MKFNPDIWNETIKRLTHNSNAGWKDMRELVHDIQTIKDFQIDSIREGIFALGIEYQKTIQLREETVQNNNEDLQFERQQLKLDK